MSGVYRRQAIPRLPASDAAELRTTSSGSTTQINICRTRRRRPKVSASNPVVDRPLWKCAAKVRQKPSD